MKVFLITQECEDPYYPPSTLCVCATEACALNTISKWHNQYNEKYHESMSITDYIRYHDLKIEEKEESE